ncbi:unknown protein [Waddlia chondrophila 2032/99]|uniref:Uncharacterized protein n=1 Tax=Waddlia chondrophila 2032/99 TaxID=765953 RepID=F8LFE3_9BACT|nr:unknown protein [Waddlia chondrophila 2032/99]
MSSNKLTCALLASLFPGAPILEVDSV